MSNTDRANLSTDEQRTDSHQTRNDRDTETEKLLKETGGTSVGRSGDILLCPDGAHRWYYEFPMMKNPTILFTIWKIMLIAALAPALLVLFTDIANGILPAIQQFFIVYGIVFGIIVVLSCIGYFILAATYDFTYIVLFEMNDEGITHAQQEKQFKKAQAIGWLTALAGTAQGNPGTVGTGILTATKQTTTSEFKNVSKVIGLQKRNTIKVNQLLSKNQVYAKEEDFDYVWGFISSRCEKAEIKRR